MAKINQFRKDRELWKRETARGEDRKLERQEEKAKDEQVGKAFDELLESLAEGKEEEKEDEKGEIILETDQDGNVFGWLLPKNLQEKGNAEEEIEKESLPDKVVRETLQGRFFSNESQKSAANSQKTTSAGA